MADTPKQPATPEERADNTKAVAQRPVKLEDGLANSDPIAPADQFESPYEQNVHQTDPHRDLAPEEDDGFFNEYRTPGESMDLQAAHTHAALAEERVAAARALGEGTFRPVPWWTVGAGLLLLWGGYYMGAYNGGLGGDVFIEEANYKPVASGPPLDPKSPEAMAAAGQKIYTVNCVQCHQSSGLGQAGQFPPLVGSEWVVGDAPKRLQQILLHGIQGKITVKGSEYNNAMPAWNATLTDKQIAQVLTYVRTKLGGNSATPITEEQMAAARKETADHNDPWTESQLLAIPAGPIDGGASAAPAAGNMPPDGNANPPNSERGANKPAAAPLGQGPATPAPTPAP